MKSSDETLIRSLFDEAKKLEPVFRTRIAGALSNRQLGGPIFSSNSLKTHPFQKKYSKDIEAIHLHAENNLLVKAIRLIPDEIHKSTIYLARARYNCDGEWEYGNCRPCDGCQRAFAAFGIKKIFYTEDSGKISKL
jgi:deoxycytidylate deaminase